MLPVPIDYQVDSSEKITDLQIFNYAFEYISKLWWGSQTKIKFAMKCQSYSNSHDCDYQ